MKQDLVRALKKVLNEEIEVIVEPPKNSTFGDYTTNIALSLAKKLKKNPNEVAKDLAQKLKAENIQGIGEIEVVGGFINFRLSNEYLHKQAQAIIKQGSKYGSSDLGKGKKASVEFISANPTGPLHIGNARGGPLGDVLSNVLEKVGYEVAREYLHNDVGGQVKKLGQTLYYAIHSDEKSEEELAYKGDYIKELASKLSGKVKKGADFEEVGRMGVQILFEEIMSEVEKMGIKFDKVRKESDLRKDVPRVLEELQKKSVLKEKDGALWFAPSDEFLKDRETVVKKSDGELTYFASDIVYHKEKFESGPDLVIDVLGGNHSGHVPRLQAAVKALGFDVSKFHVILYQFVRIKKGTEVVKMSKRAGDFVTAREVLDQVGKDAFRFFLLMTGPDTHMDFDIDLASLRSSENPVFSVQYAHSRMESIFKKAGKLVNPEFKLLKEEEELELLRKLVKFPEMILEISENFSVHWLTAYALELSNSFHKFYEAHKVISEDKDLTNARLSLVAATQIILKETLDLLGVSAPDHM